MVNFGKDAFRSIPMPTAASAPLMGTTELGHGTTFTDAGVGIGMKKGESEI